LRTVLRGDGSDDDDCPAVANMDELAAMMLTGEAAWALEEQPAAELERGEVVPVAAAAAGGGKPVSWREKAEKARLARMR
jgi:hypothetical protein